MDRPCVLIVDDDEAVVSVVCRILGKAGFQVCTAVSSAEALKVLNTRKVKILIYDLGVSGERGAFDFLASIHSAQPAVSILLITGFATQETFEEASRLGIRLMEKPFGATELLAQMSFMMARSKHSAA